MQLFSRKIISLYTKKIPPHIRRLHHLDPAGAFVIVAAVRTPWGAALGQLSSVHSSELASLVVEAAVKQSGVPLERVKRIYIAEKPCFYLRASIKCIAQRCGEFLKKAKFISISEEGYVGLKALLMAMEALRTNKSDFVVVGGVESSSERQYQEAKWSSEPIPRVSSDTNNAYNQRSKESHQKATHDGLYEAELVPLRALQLSGKRRVQKEITQDEISEQNKKECDGAAALVLTTMEKALEYNLKPLATIKGIEFADNSADDARATLLNVIQNLVLRTKVDTGHIEHWEVNNLPILIDFIQNNFNIPGDHINPYGSSALGDSSATSLYRMLTHMAHALKPSKLGCLISTDSQQSLAVLVEKLPTTASSGQLPQLTLFTKDPCPLCDMLVEELDLQFPGEYNLEKIYIDTKANVRYLRLYRHDIPVLYLNGQYLCMHRLNVRLLRKKLAELKQQQ